MENSISGSIDGMRKKQDETKKDFVKNLEEVKSEIEEEIEKEEKLINKLFEKKGIEEYYDLFKLYIEYKSLKDAREVLLKSISFMPKEKTEEMIKELINLEELLK
jgi:5'-deoxynucleotidase YfbR-like HD superfamily hydrolase